MKLFRTSLGITLILALVTTTGCFQKKSEQTETVKNDTGTVTIHP